MRILLLFASLMTGDAWAWNLPFRCDGQPLEMGFHLKEDVLDLCGEPEAVEHRVVYRGDRGSIAQSSELQQIEVDYWQYQSVHRYILKFENNLLTSIQDLDH